MKSHCVALGMALFYATPAWCQPAASQAEYSRGMDLLTQGDAPAAERALTLFRDLWVTRHEARALYLEGVAEGALGRFVEAEGYIQQALAQRADPWITRNRASVESTLRTTQQHLGELEVICTTPASSLEIEGQPVPSWPAQTVVRVIAGTSHFTLRGPGLLPVTRTVNVAAGERVREQVRLTPAPPGATDPGQTAPLVPPPVVTEAMGSGIRAAGWVLLGVGAAGVGVGVAGSVMEQQVYSDSDRSCRVEMNATQCDADRARYDVVRPMQYAGYIAGGALAVTGVILLLTAPSGAHTRASAWRCSPGPGAVGLSCGLSF